MKLEKASKSKSYMRVALQGASGSGKTYSALRLAFGLTRNDNIAIVDTENGSAHLYSSLGNYQVLQLTAPFFRMLLVRTLQRFKATCSLYAVSRLVR